MPDARHQSPGTGRLGVGLRRGEKNAKKAGAWRFEKPAPHARNAPPEAPESLISRKTVAEVPLTGLSSTGRQVGLYDVSKKEAGKILDLWTTQVTA